jgi:putative addiction module CopG family antidote
MADGFVQLMAIPGAFWESAARISSFAMLWAGGAAMSMDFSPGVEARIQKWVASGRYSDANAVVGEAMRLLIEHERLGQQRASLEIGQQDGLRGDPIGIAPDEEREAPQQR